MMKLELKNIGGLAGTHEYDLQLGVNRITGPNASGKSSIIRGIECLVTDDNDLFRRTLNDDNDIGYVKFGKYERNLQRTDAKTVKAPIYDKTFYEKKSDWRLADDIVFFTPESNIVTEIEHGNFDVSRYIERISVTEELKRNIFEKEQQIGAKNLELEQYIDNLTHAQKLEADIELLEYGIEELQEEEAKLEKETGNKDLKDVISEIALKKRDTREMEERLRRREGDVKLYMDKYETAKGSYDRLDAVIRKFEVNYPDPESQRDVFKDKIRVHEDKKAILRYEKEEIDKIHWLVEDAYEMLGDSSVCPCCNQSTSLESLDERRKEFRSKGAELEHRIKLVDEQIKPTKTEIIDVNNSIKNQSSQRRERDRFRAEMIAAKKELDERQNLTDDIDGEITILEDELKVLQKDYTEVSSSLKSEGKDELKRILEMIAGFENEIKTTRRDIDNLVENIPDYIIGERFGDYANKNNSGLEKLRNEVAVLKEQYKKEMFGAIDKFNSNIQDIYNNLGFKRFNKLEIVKKMNMDELDSLNLIMQDENGTGQALDTLTKAEQLTIGMVLQISAKDNYMPAFPFFVLDENIDAYDQNRYEGVLKYLADKAEYVILSQKVPYSEQKEVVIKYGIA